MSAARGEYWRKALMDPDYLEHKERWLEALLATKSVLASYQEELTVRSLELLDGRRKLIRAEWARFLLMGLFGATRRLEQCRKLVSDLSVECDDLGMSVAARQAEFGSAQRIYREKEAKYWDCYHSYPGDWDVRRTAVMRLHGRVCQGCGCHRRKRGGRRQLHVHHIRPLSQGGSNELENLTLLCARCHSQVDDLHRQAFACRRRCPNTQFAPLSRRERSEK